MKKINTTAQFLRDRGFMGELGIILGTGLGNLINEVKKEAEISYEEIPGFPVSTVESHHGKLIKGKIGGKVVLILQGRFHFYEGYSMREITFPVRVLHALGIKHLLVSNAAGAVNLAYQKGDLMLLDDHINFLPGNPLIGKNYDELGPRFPDMSQPYNAELNGLMEEAANALKITLQKGVYLVQSGPTLETRAEYRMMRMLGADVVGMSTVPEVIVANQMGLPVAAVSAVADIGDPDNLKPVSLEEILAVAAVAEKKLSALFKRVIELIN